MTRRSIASVAALFVTSACVQLGPTKDVTRFFVLSPEPDTDAIALIADGPLLAVGPVTLPEYLNRSAIVARVGPHEVDRLSKDRWAQPLAGMIQRTLAVDLAAAFGARRYLLYPWPRDQEPDIVVEVDVLRFEPDKTQTARLDALWRLRLGDEERTGTTALTEAVADTTTGAAVASLSALLGRMSAQLVEAAKD
jgi:uncharacterized lipoprotein YmbA